MARSRNIKPSFFTNDVLADCSPLSRILFAGLWVIADREGRLEDRPKKIKAEVLPYDTCDIEDLLCELDKAGFILRYEVEKSDYIQIISFKKHQNPHQKEQASLIPGPEKAVRVSDKSGACPVQKPVEPCLNLNPDSPIPQPLTLIPEASDIFHLDGAQFNADMLFEVFWNDYPSTSARGHKGEAKALFIKLLKSGEKHDDIIEGTRLYARYCAETNTYNKNASTFLNPKKRLWAGDWDHGGGGGKKSFGTGLQAVAEGFGKAIADDE